MSMSGSINFQTSNIDSLIFRKIIEEMLNFGWSYNDNGKLSFMIGDFDAYRTDLSDYEQVIGKISLNVDCSLPSGITLLWENTGIGGEFLFINPEKILFNLSINPV